MFFGPLGSPRARKRKLQTEIFLLPSTIPEKDRKSAGKLAGKIFKNAGKSSGHFSGHFKVIQDFAFEKKALWLANFLAKSLKFVLDFFLSSFPN